MSRKNGIDLKNEKVYNNKGMTSVRRILQY